VDARTTISRLHHRLGFGITGDALDAAVARGVEATVAATFGPTPAGAPTPPDPFAGLDLTFEKGKVAEQTVAMVAAWIGRMVASPRPVADRMGWFWHGHFVSSIEKVRRPALMARQIDLFLAAGLGSFVDLVKAVTIDPAMLWYLDGRDSTAAAPNENYGRELLELFTLGRGNYSETDVQAGARALTGYRLANDDAAPTFVPRRHDDRLQRYLGLDGVHDVDGVVRAATHHPACAPFVTAKLARAVVGPSTDDAHLSALSAGFTSSGLQIGALVGALARLLADGVDGGPVVQPPVPWLVHALRATGATLDPKVLARGVRAAGQLPFAPPNVAGWPSGAAWFASATIVARFDLAAAIATAAPADNACAAAAAKGDLDALAHALGRPGPFVPATLAALREVSDGPSRLVVALTAPDLVLV
jgi:uncharacterized protein (DUF1800 family)